MKIMLIITKSELGGAQSVVINIANELCHNNEVLIIAGEGDGTLWKLLDKKIQTVFCPYLKRKISPLNDIKTFFFFKKIYNKFKPDVIHLHSSKAGLLGRVALPTKKILYTVHGFDSIRIAFHKLLPIEKCMQYFCHTIVGVSKYDIKNLRDNHITKRLTLVYNGIKHIDNNEDKLKDIRQKYQKIVLCIARSAKPKRMDIFLETARKLPNVGFVWIGNQEEVLNKENNVFFLGSIPNASVYCSSTDLFMLPSDYEGLPMVIIEAMSYAKPIVASKVGGIPEIVIDGTNGYTLENNANKFAQKISEILGKQDTYYKFSENSLRLYKKSFTIEHMVNNYYKIYQQIYYSSKHP